MANSIALAEKFQPILDDIYKRESLTSFLDAPTKPVNFAGANEVKVFKTSLVGLGTYSRATGYPAGDVTGTWETIQLTAQRGRSFSVDAMDNEETLGMAFGTLVGEFMRTLVIPEIDAYRFNRYASWSDIQEVNSEAALEDAAAVLAAIDVGSAALDSEEVPLEGRHLFISSAINRLLNASVTRSLKNERELERRLQRLDEMTIHVVPQGRFYKGITLNAGATSNAGGYAKTPSTGRDLNFMIIHPTAVDQAIKHAPLKVFSPDENQTADAWMYQYRIYHDCWVYDNKVKGIYSHIKNS